MPNRLIWDQFVGQDAPPVVVQHVERSDTYEAHDHDFYEIVFVVSGDGTHRTIYGDEKILPGAVYLLAPGVWHEYRGCTQLRYYDLYFHPELPQNELAWLCLDPAFQYLLGNAAGTRSNYMAGVRLPEASRDACHAHLESLISMRLTRATHRSAYIGRLLLLMNELLQRIHPIQQATRTPSPIHPAVAQGTRLLREQVTHAWTLGELASTLHVAPEYLVRLFSAGTGLPPMAFLARCRCERAAALLLGSDQTIAEIAREVGWPDPNHFARRFRVFFGASPTEYRRTYRVHQRAEASGKNV
jgi:AraC family transcriptional regulator, L-rhamnose operon transcriptional activator RhaR